MNIWFVSSVELRLPILYKSNGSGPFLTYMYQNNWVVEMPDYNPSDSLLNLFECQWRQYSFFHFSNILRSLHNLLLTYLWWNFIACNLCASLQWKQRNNTIIIISKHLVSLVISKAIKKKFKLIRFLSTIFVSMVLKCLCSSAERQNQPIVAASGK